jgi:hypothetical protein
MNESNCRKKKIKRSQSQLVKFFFENRNDVCLINRLLLGKFRNELEAGEVNYFFGTVNNRNKVIS